MIVPSRNTADEHTRNLELALKEKEAALRELQHRAKNSLQLVISLLKLQSTRVRDPEARAAYDQTLQRIEALAIAYRHLHESGSETQVELGRYLSELSSINDTNPHRVDIEITTDRIIAGLSLAVPLGLIVNELLSSTLRHAFPKRGRIHVSLMRLDAERAELVVTGNGRPLPPGFDADSDAGMMLADALAAQMAATLETDIDRTGTTTRLTFPL